MTFKESGKHKAITFSYDDGVSQDLRLIELLNKYGLKCTFNLNSGLMGDRFTDDRNGRVITHYKFRPAEVRQVYTGHEIAAHTVSHPRLTELSEGQIIQEVETDRLRLSELAGYEVVGMAYPCGGINNDDRVAKIIKYNTGIAYCRTITNTDSFDLQENLYRFNPNVCHICETDRLMEMGRQFVELNADKPQIFYIWGHSYELDHEPDNWDKLEAFLQLVSGKDDIFYGTNREVLL